MRPRRITTTPFFLAILIAAIAIPLSAADWDAGVTAYKAGELQRAIDEFTNYVEARPDVYQGHQMLGLALYKSGEVERAAAHFARATELAPERPDLRLLWARALNASGDATAACDAMAELDASTLDERNATTLLQLRAKAECGGDRLTALGDLARATDDAATWAAFGSAALEAGDVETARSAAEAAAAKATTDAKVQRLYARTLIASAAATTGDERDAFYAEAVAPARIAFDRGGDVKSALVYADALMGSERFADAAVPLNAALLQDADNWAANYSLGRVRAALGATEEAAALFDRALELATAAEDDAARVRTLTAKASLFEAEERFTEAAALFAAAGASDDAARNRQNAEIAAENAEADAFNQRREEILRQQEEAERRLRELRDGGPPPRS